MMTLREKQSDFAKKVAALILYAEAEGYDVTFGHAMRCVDCPTGHLKSLHKQRLAIDLNLFKDGEYLTDGTGHDVLHRYWSMIGGSDPIQNDMNHYSLEHEGMR